MACALEERLDPHQAAEKAFKPAAACLNFSQGLVPVAPEETR
jgi:hypothetical protein